MPVHYLAGSAGGDDDEPRAQLLERWLRDGHLAAGDAAGAVDIQGGRDRCWLFIAAMIFCRSKKIIAAIHFSKNS